MYFDASLPPVPLTAVAEIARAAEALGFSTLWATETMHDPFLPGALVAEHTRSLGYGTAVAIAFGRSPATLAYTAWDLAQASQGRFILGLGTQVKAHIERRFGMPWPDSVVGKLREQIEAIHTFWNTWQNNAPFKYQGEYYRLALMSPFFNPGPIRHPNIPIYIAGVNTGLARLAGEAADGFLVHPFHTPAYRKDVLLPAIQGGLEKCARPRSAVKVSVTAFAVTSAEEDLFVRSQIAFYASTPSYRAVMDLHGWGETAEKLSALVHAGKWGELPVQVSDEMLSTFAIVCPEAELPAQLLARYAGMADRLGLYLPFVPGQRDAFWQRLVGEMTAA
ncbi:MAG: TIGR03617 family F420-dependent LLM class oxidoreductase [Chloroflexota bacterium]